MRWPHNAKFPLVEIDVSTDQISYVILNYQHFLKKTFFSAIVSKVVGTENLTLNGRGGDYVISIL